MNLIYVGEEGNVVNVIDNVPQSDIDKMVAVYTLPIREERAGYKSYLRANKATETVYYEYVKNDEVEELKAKIAELESKISANA